MFEWECDRVLSVIELKKQIETLFCIHPKCCPQNGEKTNDIDFNPVFCNHMIYID